MYNFLFSFVMCMCVCYFTDLSWFYLFTKIIRMFPFISHTLKQWMCHKKRSVFTNLVTFNCTEAISQSIFTADLRAQPPHPSLRPRGLFPFNERSKQVLRPANTILNFRDGLWIRGIQGTRKDCFFLFPHTRNIWPLVFLTPVVGKTRWTSHPVPLWVI